MRVSFERGEEVAREQRTLPAEVYNKMHLLLMHAPADHVFVPIRPMQYMAVVDAAETIFVDGQIRREVEIAWRDFRPRERSALQAPVAYSCVFYSEGAFDVMARLQNEFLKAMTLLESRRPKAPAVPIAPLRKP